MPRSPVSWSHSFVAILGASRVRHRQERRVSDSSQLRTIVTALVAVWRVVLCVARCLDPEGLWAYFLVGVTLEKYRLCPLFLPVFPEAIARPTSVRSNQMSLATFPLKDKMLQKPYLQFLRCSSNSKKVSLAHLESTTGFCRINGLDLVSLMKRLVASSVPSLSLRLVMYSMSNELRSLNKHKVNRYFCLSKMFGC